MRMMEPIKKVTFCVHDENETTLQYVEFSTVESYWVLKDKRGLSITFERFADALVNMCIMTGVDAADLTILGD